ncbi:hypothetical protein ASPNIDRAFT_190840, partial [Aspergillus niger ATCC 1015]
MDGSTGWAEQLSIALDYKNALSSIVPFKEYQKRISKTIGGRTPLSCAAEGGNPKIVRMLLEDGEDVNERDADRSNGVPLHYAVYDESLEAFELLLQQKARQGSNGRTALHIAAARGSIEDMVLLLENGADVNISSAEGLTALDLAAIQGNLEMVTLLLDHNAKVDTLGIRKMTPLDQ